MILKLIPLKHLEQDNTNGQKELKEMFKNIYPELGRNIDNYFDNDNFLSKEEMANIIEKKQFNERLLTIHVNKNILTKTGHKILTPTDREVGRTVSKFLRDVFILYGFNKVGRKINNGINP